MIGSKVLHYYELYTEVTSAQYVPNIQTEYNAFQKKINNNISQQSCCMPGIMH